MHSLFAQVFPDEMVLNQITLAAGLSFANGLLETIGSADPPSLEFFKTLPVETSKRWGIYIVVLQKNNVPTPLIYCGSGTHARLGVGNRWSQYILGSKYLPKYVEEALLEGYTITHKGLLV